MSTQNQIDACLGHGELINTINRECPADVYWLFEFLFPSNRMRFSENGVFNILEHIESVTGPAQFTTQCAVNATVVETGESLSLESFTAPRIWEEIHVGVCDTENLIVHPMTGRKFMNFQEQVDYQQAKKGMVFIKRIRKRLELMAAELLKTGAMTTAGEGGPNAIIDFGRDPDNEVVLDPADMWCADGSESPIDQMDTIANNVFRCESDGMIDVIMSNAAGKAFRNHVAIMDLMKLQGDNKCIECDLMLDMFPPKTRILGQRYIGMYGRFRFWEFDGVMNLPDGMGGHTTVTMLEPNDVYMVMRDAFAGTRGYGAITDMTARGGKRYETIYFNSCIKRQGIKMDAESRPLPLAGNINATAVIKDVIGACP